MNNNYTPEIRFLGFTADWEQRKLGDITESYSGGTPSVGKKSYYGGSIPFIRSAEINSDSTELFITEEGLNHSSAKMVDTGDILYALYGATSGEVGISRIQGAINQAILVMKPKFGDDSYFITQWLKKQKSTIINTYLQGGQGNLSGSIVKDLSLSLPSDKREQKQIGNFFKQLDDTIALQQQELTTLKQTKQGFLQKMFPKEGESLPEVRFQGFTGDWEQIRLGDRATIKGRLGWKSLKQEEYTSDGPSMIAGKHINNGVIDWNVVDHIPQWRYDESPEIMLKNGDLIFSKDGSLGNPALISDLNISATINSTMMLVRVDETIDPSFFYQVMKSEKFERLIYLKVSGSSIPHLFQADMNEFMFLAPVKEEQIKIGNFLKQLDDTIALHQRELDALKQTKKAFLQKMFV